MNELKELNNKINEVRDEVRNIHSALKGYNGDMGLIPTFTKHCENDAEFRKDYYKFKRQCILIFGILIGSGVLGVSILKIIG